MDPNASDRVLLLLRLNRPAEAETAARQLIANDPDDAAGYYFLACALAARDRPAEALAASDAALARAADSAVLHAHRSGLLLAAGRVAEATAAAETALRLDPTDPDNYAHLVEAHVAADRPAAARAVLADARRQFPDDPGLLYRAAAEALGENRLDDAAALARDGLARDPENAGFHMLAGLAASRQATEQFPTGPGRQEQYQEAERTLAEAVRLWPTQAVYRALRKRNAAESRSDAVLEWLAWWLMLVLAAGAFGPWLLGYPRPPWWVWVPASFAVWAVSIVFCARYPEFSLVLPLDRADVVTIPLLPEERRLGRRLWAVFAALTVALLALPSLLFVR